MKEFQKQCRFTLLFSFLLSINLIAQNDTLSLLLDRKIANRDFNFSPDLWKSADFQQEIPKRMVKISEHIFQFPHPVRDDYYDALHKVYETVQNQEDRIQLLGALLHSCNDQSEWLRAHNMRHLAAYVKPEDFNKGYLDELYELLVDTTYHRTPLFPIVGRLEWKKGELLMERFFQEGPEILPLDEDRPGGFIASPKWKAAIALARKGHEKATQYLISKSRQQVDHKDPMVLMEVFNQLTMIRTRPILDFLIEFLYSDRKYVGLGHMEESDFTTAYLALHGLIEGLWETYGIINDTRAWMDKNRTSYKIIKE